MKTPISFKPHQRLSPWWLAVLVLLTAVPAQAQLSVFQVRDASGAAVAGAVVCLGTQGNLAEFGQNETDTWGNAQLQAALPTGENLYITASKGGYGTQHIQAISAYVPPAAVSLQLTLPASPGGPSCPGGSGGIFPQIAVSPAEILAGQLFDIIVFLDNPPLGPLTLKLESSDARLVRLPAEVTFRRGEQKKRLQVRADSLLRSPEIVTISIRPPDRRSGAQARLAVRPALGKK